MKPFLLFLILLMLSACAAPMATPMTPPTAELVATSPVTPPTAELVATSPVPASPTPTQNPDYEKASFGEKQTGNEIKSGASGQNTLNTSHFKEIGLKPLSPDGKLIARVDAKDTDFIFLPHPEKLSYKDANGKTLTYSFSHMEGDFAVYTNGGAKIKMLTRAPIQFVNLACIDENGQAVGAKYTTGWIEVYPLVYPGSYDVKFDKKGLTVNGEKAPPKIYKKQNNKWVLATPTPTATSEPSPTADTLPQPEPVTQSLEQPTNPPVFEIKNSYHKDEALSNITPENIQKSLLARLAAARIFASEILGQPQELNLDNLDSFLKEQKDKKPYFKIIQLWSDPEAGGGELLTAITYRKNANDHVLWFGNQDGTLAGRPDAGGQAVYEVGVPSGYRVKFNWGEDGNPYLFAVGGGNKFVPDDAAFWFDTTKVTDARDKENLASAWTHVELPEASFRNPNFNKALASTKSYNGISLSEKYNYEFYLECDIMLIGYNQTEGLFAVGAYRGKEFRVSLTSLILAERQIVGIRENYFSHNLTRAQLNRILQVAKDDINNSDVFLSNIEFSFGSPSDATDCNKYNPPFSPPAEFIKACQASLSRPGIKKGVPLDKLVSQFKQNPQKTAAETPLVSLMLYKP